MPTLQAIGLITWLSYAGFTTTSLGFWFSWVTGILIFTVIQAIAICCLRKRTKDTALYIDSESLFSTTADIKNYSQIHFIINKLENRINRIWKEDLNTRFTLTYWLGVQHDGEIIACHPFNQVSQDNFAATPLSQLISKPTEIITATAKLQITFDDPGIVNIISLSGIPLHLIAIRFLSIITIFSVPVMYMMLYITTKFS